MVEKIKRLCREKGLSLNKLQKDLGFPHNAIYRWDTNRPTIDRVKSVADQLGVTVDELLEEDEKK